MGIPKPKLSEEQAKRLIQTLYDNKGVKSALEIAEEMAIKPTSVKAMAKRLERMGITVELRRNPSPSFYKLIIEEWKRAQGL